MKYQIRRYKIDNQQGGVFRKTAQEEAVRIHKEDVDEDYTVFITDKAVSGFHGDMGIIESDSNGDKIEVIREPFVQAPITLRELLDITPNLLADYERFTLLTDIQKALFEKRYSELDGRFVELKEDLSNYKLSLMNRLYPLVKQDKTLTAYLELRKEIDNKNAENEEAIAKLSDFKQSLEAEYNNALTYMRTDEERQKLTEQHQKSIDFVSDRLKEILENGSALLDKAVSDDIVTQIRDVAESHKEAYQLLEDLSEARQLLAYIREEPYPMTELTITELGEAFIALKEDHTAKQEATVTDEVSEVIEEQEVNDEITLAELEDKSVTVSSSETEDKEAELEDEDAEDVAVAETVRGSRAIANLMKEINADYVADSELEEIETETWSEDNKKIDKEEVEKMGTPDKGTTQDDSYVSVAAKSKSKGFSIKTGAIISGVLFVASLAGSLFLYKNYDQETTLIKKEVVEKAKVLEELQEVNELEKEVYEDLIGRFLENHEGTKENKRDGLSGVFSHDGTLYFVRRFVRETGTLETYNKAGKKVDFNVEEIETIIENGEY